MARLSLPVEKADHSIGPEDAVVTLVQYGSYDCPHCRQAISIVDEVRQRCDMPLRYVYRHFPQETPHSESHRAAEAAEAAAKQGKFWEMHNHLMENQNALDDASLLAYATMQGLDAQEVAGEMESGAHAEEVRRQFLSGLESGVHSTPTFFINGVRHDDYWDAETLCAAVQSAAR
jgi:protein-disulfide isomerase